MDKDRATVTVAEAARLAAVSEATVRRWCSHMLVRATRIPPTKGAWRIDRHDLLRKLGKEA